MEGLREIRILVTAAHDFCCKDNMDHWLRVHIHKWPPLSLHPGKTAFRYEGLTQVHMETLPESNATAMETETTLSYEQRRQL